MDMFKETCIELRRADYSLGEIVKITGRPKTSVYAHVWNIPLSAKKQETIKEARRERVLKLAARRRGKSARAFKKFSTWSDRKVTLIAHLLFDGEIRKIGCSYNNRSGVLVQKVEKLMKDIYEYEPKRYFNKATGVSRISYYNVALGTYLEQKSKELFISVPSMPVSMKRVFLQAFFDDEGCMDFRPARNLRRVRGYQKNIEVLKVIERLLSDFGIHATIKKPNEVVVTGKTNLEKFRKEINFSSGVCINGKRPNSIWKKSLEKRELLARAIHSFKPIGRNGVHRR